MNDRNMEIMNDLRNGFLPFLTFEVGVIEKMAEMEMNNIKDLQKELYIAKDQSSESFHKNSAIRIVMADIAQAERRVNSIMEKLKRISVYEVPDSDEEVTIGSIVTIEYPFDNFVDRILIAGEANFKYSDDDIDNVAGITANLGLALIGRKVGDIVDVDAKAKRFSKCKVLKISSIGPDFFIKPEENNY